MVKMVRRYFLGFGLLFFSVFAIAQKDSLILSNGDIMVGEIKSMNHGILHIETPYSDQDFTVKWDEVKEVYSTTRFLITLQDGQRVNGILSTDDSGHFILESDDDQLIQTTNEDIVNLVGLKSEFWSRVDASIDRWFSFTKANNIKQGTLNIGAGYLGDHWSSDVFYNLFRSVQDSIDATNRNEAGLNYKYYLQHDWYLMADGNYLSNTEQALKSRYTGKLGAGKFLIHSNQSYWGLGAGISVNLESFTNGTESKNSTEAYAGSELNLFDTGDLSLLSTLYVYPSLTEANRIRSDFRIDTKYEFTDDLFIKFNLTLNYDNKPAIEGKETDYVYGISLGWEF
jgi:hypothetical protein